MMLSPVVSVNEMDFRMWRSTERISPRRIVLTIETNLKRMRMA